MSHPSGFPPPGPTNPDPEAAAAAAAAAAAGARAAAAAIPVWGRWKKSLNGCDGNAYPSLFATCPSRDERNDEEEEE